MEEYEILNFIQITLLVALLLMVSKNMPQLKGRKRRVVVDTCALIDGRILDVSRTGFMSNDIVVPEFVIDELQTLADGQDSHKRERARFGLDVVNTLQSEKKVKVKIKKYNIGSDLPTDNRLVLLAKKLSADLCTIDYNLNKVADIHGVKVLNVNELSNAVRPVALPGEKKRIKIIQKGSSKNQGVGYLDDGSMVVVDGAARMIGKVVDVEIVRYLQTDAGKMIFASIVRSNRRG